MRRVVLVSLAACTPAPYVPDGATTGDATSGTADSTSGEDENTGDAPVKLVFDLKFELAWPDDLDGDGHLDLLLDSSVGPARFVRGGGEGKFYAPIEIGDPELGPGRPSGVGDFDGDGVRDLVVHNGESRFVTGTGLGGAMATWPIGEGHLLGVADVHGDGRDDLFFYTSGLRPYYSAADGQPIAQPLLAVGAEPGGFVAADLDGDGALDLMVSNHGTDDISLLRGDGNGGFAPQRLVPALAGPRTVGVADLDADGILDLLVAGRVGLLALRGLGELRYAPIGTALPYLSVGPLDWWENSARLCDRDGDPYPDVVLSLHDYDADTDRIAQIHGGPDLRFGALELILAENFLTEIACADFDEDGLDDLLYVRRPAMQLVFVPTARR